VTLTVILVICTSLTLIIPGGFAQDEKVEAKKVEEPKAEKKPLIGQVGSPPKAKGTRDLSDQGKILEISKLVILDYREKFDFLKTLITWASLLIVLIITGFGIYGLMEFKILRSELKKELEAGLTQAQQTQDNMKGEIAREQQKLENLRTEILALQEKLYRSFQGMVSLTAANEVMRGEETGKTLRRAEKHIDRAVKVLKPEDVQLYRSARGIQAFILKRLAGPEKALEVIEPVLSNDEDGNLHYNAACYAALAGRSDRWPTYLRESIKRNPYYREQANIDEDFANVRQSEDYMQIIQ